MATPSILLGPIVGGLSHNSANIWARADASSTLHVWLATRADTKDAKHAGETDLFSNDGFAGIVPITKLRPETRYYYAVSLRKTKPARTKFHNFTTFPKPSARHSFSFVFGSCYLPNGENESQTFEEIYKHISLDQLRFGLFVGDQIYADDARRNGLGKIAVTLEDYRSVYAHAWSRPSVHKLLPSLPAFMILDDHEVDNDWRFNDLERNSPYIPFHVRLLRQITGAPAEQCSLSMERVRAALKAYQEHQAIHAPNMLMPIQADAQGRFLFQRGDEGTFAYTFVFGSAAFFVLDTRTRRVKKERNILLGEAQWQQLEEWLLSVKDKYPVKFLISSGTIMYPFWLDVAGDRWAGFRPERERLFKFLAENEIEGVHILAGDLHSAHCVSAEIKCPSGRRIPIWEFCSSPFEQATNVISFTYFPIISKWIRNQKKLFRQRGHNFGIVHVDFDGPTPRVTFTLHYNDGGWKTRPAIITSNSSNS
ncbi:MAG TPA: metallophosphoesterase family protein [Anaerolineales bacterium]|nr:metallophosphoesterase family protein [Anaerolineales bacterium]